jgi:ribonuclease HI
LALASWEVTSKLVKSCVQAVNKLGGQNVCKLAWVPGHSGIEGNEIADQQANIGSCKNFIGPNPCLPITRATVKFEIKEHFQSIANE